MKILLIDDDAGLRRTFRLTFEALGHSVTDARDRAQALEHLGHRAFDICFLDMRLASEQGLDLLPELLRLSPALPIVVITAYATIETAVEAMRRGAYDYLPKPFTPDQLRLVLDRVARTRHLQIQVDDLQAQVRSFIPEVDLRTVEPVMQKALDIAYRAAASEATILMRGESGTGKGVLARTIHARSLRSEGPFVTVNCPSLSAELLESDLFGHVIGAFTGAVRDTHGKVAAAQGGTLFLDEIGDLPIGLQPKLLRLLQEKRYERVGETQTRACELRIVTATNRELESQIALGQFREDLFFRLNVIAITLPPLRARPHDILPMAEHLLGFFARQSGKPLSGFSEEAKVAIQRYPWPGNIRELRNAIERGVILTTGPAVGLSDLPMQLGEPKGSAMEVGARVTLDEIEAEHIRRVLSATATIEETADVLGIDPSTLYRKRKRYGL